MEIWKRKLVNTNKFRVPALRFKDYGGYCNSPEGTTSYFEYWDKESRRCIYGDYFDGDYISGYNYYYLNYSPILLVRDKVDSVTGKVTYERVVDFPDFWDFDYFYFNYLDEAEKLGKHAAVIKTRGRGYSFKGGSMLARNFSLIPGSKSYAVASGQEYLTKDGILSKCWDVLSFMDEHTAWGKRKHRKDLPMHKRASYLENVNGKLTEKGYKSEVIGITLGNDTHKARGKRGKLMLWEESGSNSRLLDAWNIARPSFEQNRQTFGLMVAFGTGGDDGDGFTGLRELFNNTDGYNIHGIDNIFEPGSGNTKVGFFVPESSNYRSDADGNSLVEESLVLIEDDRAKIRNNAKSKRTYDQYVAEHPLTPSEALLRVKGNIFPLTDLLEHLSWLEGNDTANTFGNKGSLVFDDSGKLAWVPQPHGVYIKDFPLNGDYDADTSIMVWEHPVDNTPNGLYICGCDPYDHDKSSSGSLGSMFVYKRFHDFDGTYNCLVAEYTARPNAGADAFYENCRRLALYYNAIILYENQVKGMHTYFKHKNSEFLLADTPTFLKDVTKVKDSVSLSRGKGIHMPKQIKDFLEGKTRDWMLQEVSDGKLNLHMIYSIPLLKELIAYDGEINTDRVIAFFLCIAQNLEMQNVHVRKKEEYIKENDFFARVHFRDKIRESYFGR